MTWFEYYGETENRSQFVLFTDFMAIGNIII